jgi:hypothetical protein
LGFQWSDAKGHELRCLAVAWVFAFGRQEDPPFFAGMDLWELHPHGEDASLTWAEEDAGAAAGAHCPAPDRLAATLHAAHDRLCELASPERDVDVIFFDGLHAGRRIDSPLGRARSV